MENTGKKALDSSADLLIIPTVQAESLFVRAEDSFWRAPIKGPRLAVLAMVVTALLFVLFAAKPWVVATAAAERAAAGEKSLLAHDVARGLWFGFLGCAIAGVFLLLTWKRWCRPISSPSRGMPIAPERLGKPAFWLLLVSAIGLGAAVRWNLATRGLWWDELWSVKHASLGYQKPTGEPETGEFRFLKRSWSSTIWEYRKPTNHAQASITSRVSQSVWRAQTGAEPYAFSALAVRAPALLAGMASILAIAVLVRRWGFAIGGITAAFLLAMHPWHMRYGTEARGYSFAVLWTVLGCLWLTRAVTDEHGRWRYWLLFGLNQLLITWCLPNGFYYAAGFALVGAFLAFHRWSNREDRLTVLWRLVAVNIMAAMVFLPLFMPNVLQMLRWGEINDFNFLDWPNLQNALSQLAFGMNVGGGDGVGTGGIPNLHHELQTSPWGAWPTMALLALGIVIGAARLIRTRPGAALILGSIVAAAIGSLLVTKLAGQFFYHRYIIYTIVPFAILIGIGLAGFSKAITERRRAAALVGIAALSLYFYSTRDARSLLLSRAYAPFEEIAIHLESRGKGERDLRVIGYGLGGRMLSMYYPKSRFAKNKAQLEQEITDAVAKGAPYVIVLGYEGVNRNAPEYKDGFEILDQPAAFFESRHFVGIDPLFYFRILEPTIEPSGE